ncbi:MAG: hypothetical protein HC846_01275 [Blastocatellia bacterium]|nr:hypothetical protein [Blastocatellia bacterium]
MEYFAPIIKIIASLLPFIPGIPDKRIDALIKHLIKIADCLDEMHEKLLKEEVPTKAGTEYAVALRGFESMVKKTFFR